MQVGLNQLAEQHEDVRKALRLREKQKMQLQASQSPIRLPCLKMPTCVLVFYLLRRPVSALLDPSLVLKTSCLRTVTALDGLSEWRGSYCHTLLSCACATCVLPCTHRGDDSLLLCFVSGVAVTGTLSGLLTHLPAVAEDALDALLACHYVLFEEISLLIASLST